MTERATLVAAMLVLAGGTFAFRLAGPYLRSRATFPPRVEKLMGISTVVLLTSLVATTALTEGGGPAGVARPVGVLAAGLLAWRKVPFLIVVLAAAAATAALRLLGVP
ncbi:AzlD domain-containing protein [Streptomyces sp. SCA3-4]|uniref:AzlD domain-containing protein n=1 Tax=Streptomyces sichuanensis TaxID=2871810 RepID=UPI001CE2F3D7|nr:AzlD domain-containing protein [Streptomyces sichuanensis]MCA6091895.1 AzlD domain-containing protein [Streptomyces sichuanensis]